MAETAFPYNSTTPDSLMASIYQPYQQVNVERIKNDAYIKGHIAGGIEMKQELMKMGEALFNLAFGKIEEITNYLIDIAEKNNITIFDFYLMVENWDSLRSLIVVKLDDYLDDKIELLYQAAYDKATEVNNDSFGWNYTITYFTENLNKGKIHTDGYTLLYEHTTKPCEA